MLDLLWLGLLALALIAIGTAWAKTPKAVAEMLDPVASNGMTTKDMFSVLMESSQEAIDVLEIDAPESEPSRVPESWLDKPQAKVARWEWVDVVRLPGEEITKYNSNRGIEFEGTLYLLACEDGDCLLGYGAPPKASGGTACPNGAIVKMHANHFNEMSALYDSAKRDAVDEAERTERLLSQIE